MSNWPIPSLQISILCSGNNKLVNNPNSSYRVLLMSSCTPFARMFSEVAQLLCWLFSIPLWVQFPFLWYLQFKIILLKKGKYYNILAALLIPLELLSSFYFFTFKICLNLFPTIDGFPSWFNLAIFNQSSHWWQNPQFISTNSWRLISLQRTMRNLEGRAVGYFGWFGGKEMT